MFGLLMSPTRRSSSKTFTKLFFLGPKSTDQPLDHCSFNWTLWVASSISSLTLLCQNFLTLAPHLSHTFCFLRKTLPIIFYYKNNTIQWWNIENHKERFLNDLILHCEYYGIIIYPVFKFYLNFYLYIMI